MISLPKQWAEERGIEPGSLVSVEPNDGRLTVEVDDSSVAHERKTIRRDVTGADERLVERVVEATYAVGYDTVTLTSRTGFSDDIRRAVRSFVARRIGVEMMEETERRLSIRNLTSADGLSVRKTALRLSIVAQAMYRDATAALVEDDADLAAAVLEREDEARKLYALIDRHFHRALSDLGEADRLGHTRNELFEYRVTALHLESVARRAAEIARTRRSDGPLPAALVSLFEQHATEARHLVDRTADVMFAEASPKRAHRLVRDCEMQLEITTDVMQDVLIHDVDTDEYRLFRLLNSVRRTVGHTRSIGDAALRRTLSE